MGITNLQQCEERQLRVNADIGGGPRLQVASMSGDVQSFRADHVEIIYGWNHGEPGSRKIFVKLTGRTVLRTGHPGKRLAAKVWGGPWAVTDLDDDLFGLPGDIEALVRKLAPEAWEAAA